MNRMSMMGVAAMSAMMASGAIPEVSNVAISQPGGKSALVTYALANGPAVVTLDIETNGPSGWASIGLENVYGSMESVSGDANRVVSGSTGSIVWNAHHSWADQQITGSGLRAKVTAYPLDDTPDYMVVDLRAGDNSADRIRYYASSNSLPGGGLFGTDAYRTTHLVLKKVIAKGIPWTMGSANAFLPTGIYAREKPHTVTLSNNYYLAVFPITSMQGTLIFGSQKSCSFSTDSDMRILDMLCFKNSGSGAVRLTGYPAEPDSNSLVGKLRAKTANAVDFDLPSEAQWEYAAKAGSGEGYWGRLDLPIEVSSTDSYLADANLQGRYLANQATDWVRTDSGANTLADWLAYRGTMGPTNGIPIAGSYAPNEWGFYDMFGSVYEWCQDWYQEDITSLGGAINANGDTCLDGTTSEYRVLRGGSWFSKAYACRPSFRGVGKETYPGDCFEAGLRVCCRAGLK